MQEFAYMKPNTVDELLSLLSGQYANPKILSGGTDLIMQLSDDKVTTDVVIDIKAIPEVNELKFDEQGLFIGSAITCLSLNTNNQLKNSYTGLVDAFSLIGGYQIQGRASIGGNVCNASPAADSVPALIVHNAKCIVTGKSGSRKVPVEDFFTAPGKTVLTNDEFLVGIQVPKPELGFGACYQRFIPRNEMDIAVVGVGSSVKVNKETSLIEQVRISLGAVAPTVLYVKEASSPLIGQSINDQLIEEKIKEASILAKILAKPITDMRGSADQRKHLVEVLTRRTLTKAVERAKKSLGN